MDINPLSAIANTVTTVVNKFVPDKDTALKLSAELNQQVTTLVKAHLESSANIIIAEANGNSWLQRNWRPLIMLLLSGLIGAHWLGFTPENLDREMVLRLFDIVEIGVGGYVVLNGIEKGAKALSGRGVFDRLRGRNQ